MLRKFSSDKITDTKSVLFFLSQAPTHHSFTVNLRFLYELKHKVRFRFIFIKVYIFAQQNAWTP